MVKIIFESDNGIGHEVYDSGLRVSQVEEKYQSLGTTVIRLRRQVKRFVIVDLFNPLKTMPDSRITDLVNGIIFCFVSCRENLSLHKKKICLI